MKVRTFAFVYGAVFLIVAIAGFIPGMTAPHTHPDVTVTAGMGLLLGLFPVNVLHNVFHAAFGLWGLVAGRGFDAARIYAKAVGIVYTALALMGLIPALRLHTTFGLVPLYGHDVWLHIVLAAVALYFGFRRDADR
ncbi:DUF4383 domain-containing protein [Schlegelella sp. S2-27]|uniref:DUF4383 domain-containing protein n=1 Tax=Caldimonas mangrovi TaxID=2944811 RepID=A0ABT0YMU2_9BURK|nr:DUF4383 domain-containing protein [Caldimonas mangrovi]MCM5680051.1 DUF4383 domain-containing protein [Caldimonas mangrovi]